LGGGTPGRVKTTEALVETSVFPSGEKVSGPHASSDLPKRRSSLPVRASYTTISDHHPTLWVQATNRPSGLTAG
jgi:hypothetical protein